MPIERKLFKSAKWRAKLKNLEFTLTIEDICIPKRCPVFNIPLIHGGGPNAPTIDRIDNTKGYTKQNIIIVSAKANNFKSYATIEEIKQLAAFYEQLISNK